jgi:peptide deformylase
MKETVLEIKLFGNPILRKRAKPVRGITQEERDILSKMAQLMYEKGGIGLAANQVGIDRCMIVVDTGGGLYKLINPQITKKEGTQELEEGCLSIPDICIKVKRAAKVKVEALNEDGQPVSFESEGLMACCLQHEIDHLRGKLISDYAPFLQRLKIRKKIENMQKRAKDGKLSESKTESCKLQL